ncbi:hypothetical protein AQUSIP_03340 [Aquicella siphonis]|uniref:Uncharacterized protein n=1 Tax=Aquicella siphonis TaxID=254247 RepID=A0A5E4PEY6_9COXI|nr:hypothetical protein [Aquicella siphonis]VVC75058.1 hypothetical protein AQUSIP_03340 [Aquicella siphonis]
MAMTFYPHLEDAAKGSLEERIDLLMEAAERYKAVILDESAKVAAVDPNKRMVPRDQSAAYNWEEISHVLRAIRELSESNKQDKIKKADLLAKLAEVYEVLRAAKMSKLEAVRLALISESNQLKGGAPQVV